MSAIRLLAVGLLVAGMTLGVKAEEKKAEAAKEKLVGTWEVTKADEGTAPVGATLVLSKDGKVKFTAKKDGKEQHKEGTYTVAGSKITLVAHEKDKEEKKPLKIKSLSATELVLEDDKGKTVHLKRKH